MEVCKIGTASISESSDLEVQVSNGFSTSDDVPVFGALGITARPASETESGYAEALVETTGVGECVLSMRDSRCSGIIGNLAQGDTCVHTVGPEQSCQLKLMDEKRQAALVVSNEALKDYGLFIDGKRDELTLTCPQGTIAINSEGISLVAGDGTASITIGNGKIVFNGNLYLNGFAPGQVPVAINPPGTILPTVFAVKVP